MLGDEASTRRLHESTACDDVSFASWYVAIVGDEGETTRLDVPTLEDEVSIAE